MILLFKSDSAFEKEMALKQLFIHFHFYNERYDYLGFLRIIILKIITNTKITKYRCMKNANHNNTISQMPSHIRGLQNTVNGETLFYFNLNFTLFR